MCGTVASAAAGVVVVGCLDQLLKDVVCRIAGVWRIQDTAVAADAVVVVDVVGVDAAAAAASCRYKDANISVCGRRKRSPCGGGGGGRRR